MATSKIRLENVTIDIKVKLKDRGITVLWPEAAGNSGKWEEKFACSEDITADSAHATWKAVVMGYQRRYKDHPPYGVRYGYDVYLLVVRSSSTPDVYERVGCAEVWRYRKHGIEDYVSFGNKQRITIA
jgi:hypothetical protein